MTLFIPISSSAIRWMCIAAAIAAASVAEDKSINSPTNNLFFASSLERLKYGAARNYAKSSKNKGNSRSQCTLKKKWAQRDFATIEHGEKNNQYEKIMAVHFIFLFCTRSRDAKRLLSRSPSLVTFRNVIVVFVLLACLLSSSNIATNKGKKAKRLKKRRLRLVFRLYNGNWLATQKKFPWCQRENRIKWGFTEAVQQKLCVR